MQGNIEHPGITIKSILVGQLGLRYYEVAKLIGVNPAILSHIFRGLNRLSLKMATKFATLMSNYPGLPELYTKSDYWVEINRQHYENIRKWYRNGRF